MAGKAKRKIGYDPLAWMDEEGGEAPAASTARGNGGNRRQGRKRTRGNGLNVELLESSFKLLAPRADELAQRFYDELFRRHPKVRPLFAGTSMEEQRRKLVAALTLVVNSLRKPAALKRALEDLGAKHERYGAEPAHYEAVAATLIDVMAELAGEAWTPDIQEAWENALQAIAETMLNAYSGQEAGEMAASKQAVESGLQGGAPATVVDDLDVVKDILEFAPMNIMIADADENIVFVNAKAREVLRSLESELAKYLPGFRADEVVGGSIHRYHRDPDAIRRILQGLRPGERRTGEITPGPFVFEHETRVLVDREGNRVGYVVQWQDVTEKRKEEERAQRLQRVVDNAQTAIMTIDRDLTITYVNEQTRKLMLDNADVLRGLYPGFDPERLVGTCIDMFHKNPAHQRQLLSDPRNLPYETDIQVGPLTFHIRVTAIHDLNGEYVGNTLEWADVTDLRRKETEVARLQSAVDGASANLMLCDENLVITYVNPAVRNMLANRQEELRRIWPTLDVNNLVGQNIDQFHKNPAHQRSLLKDPSRMPVRSEIKVGDLEFRVTATMITGKNGEYMGNMVQWEDITEQKDAERQIQALIQAAAAGDLEKRVDTSTYSGFMKGLGEGVNELLDAIVVPLRTGAELIKALAEGDLRRDMDGEFQGEFAEFKDSINETLRNLRDIVTRIREASGNIASAAGEIAQGNQDLSQRTEEQAASLEETASSMEQLTSTVKQNADNARQANQLAAGAREQAERGGEVVGNAVAAMAQINEASKKINDIIGVIDEIAFQTNLLALNAAVEAARAGEQGRGFAVVASEVRNLAQRSAAAAKEIKALIKDSVEKVELGSRLVNDSGETLEEIVNSVKKVSDIIAEIAAASQEQSAGIEQVNKAITQMDEVTQQNAALVEQAAAASESLNDQAQALDELMTFFKSDEGQTHAAPPRRAAAPAKAAAAAPSRRRPASRPRVEPAPQSDEDSEWEEF